MKLLKYFVFQLNKQRRLNATHNERNKALHRIFPPEASVYEIHSIKHSLCNVMHSHNILL